MWAFGVSIYCLIFLKLPFDGQNLNECEDAIVNNKPTFSQSASAGGCSEISTELKILFTAILEKDPKKRPSIGTLLDDFKWLSSN